MRASDYDPRAERAVGDYLSTSGLPDPDLIIRTSGERRLSGLRSTSRSSRRRRHPQSCSSGLGIETARVLAAAGAEVTLAVRTLAP
ncbi:undecaprenyl diphosphate synthase family protein [Streptomyces sp. NPDC017964]